MNFRTLDLNLLRVFAAVMLERNVTRAAAQLAMTQPAVSNALRRLREATGDELFVTVPSGVGRRAHAAAMWPHVEAALERPAARRFDPQGFDPTRDPRTLHAGDGRRDGDGAHAGRCSTTLLRERALADVRILPLLVARPAAAARAGQRRRRRRLLPGRRRRARRRGAAGADRAASRSTPASTSCVMRRGHPLAARPELSLDDYCAARHVRVSFAGRPRGFVDEALARVGRERRVMLTVNQFATRGPGRARLRPADGAAAQLRPGLGPGRRAGGTAFPRRAAADRREPALAPPARARRGAALAAPDLRRDRARARRLREPGDADRRGSRTDKPPSRSPEASAPPA